MSTIRLSHNFGAWPLFRQTPAGDGRWRDATFVRPDDPGSEAPDYWVVCGGLTEAETARVPPSRTVFLTGEPAAVRSYDERFLAQFGLVVTSQPAIKGPAVVHTQPALPWHIGVRRDDEGDRVTHTYAQLRDARAEKRYDLSVVCSSKVEFGGQRSRLAFVEALQLHFGERLHWFGRGVRPIADKWDAIAPYRFHVSLENSVERDYWTEKLADAYLGGAFPIYWGCPNLSDYFAEDAFAPINIDETDAAVSRIERLLAEGVSPARREAVERARNDVLARFNLFPAIVDLIGACEDGRPRTVTLRPEAEFVSQPRAPRRLLRRFSPQGPR